jgi:hypothetical protein
MGINDTLSTASMGACTSTLSGDGTYIDNDSLSTMISTTASYLSTCPCDIRMMHNANAYVNSMTIEQLEEFERQLSHELEITYKEEKNQAEEQPKVYMK